MADLERAVQAIYETVFDSENWKKAAMECARLTKSSTLFLQTLDAGSGTVNVLSAHGLEAMGVDVYKEYFHKVDIWREGLLRARRGKIHLYHEIVDQRAYEHSEVFHDWVKPAVGYDVYWGMGGTLDLHDRQSLAFLATHRSRQRGALTETEQRIFQELLPHIQCALHLRGTFDANSARARKLEAVIDACGEAMFVVDRDARLLHANRRALALLSADSPVLRVRRDGTLEATTQAENIGLRKDIAGACTPALVSNAPKRGFLILTNHNGKRLVAATVPIRQDDSFASPSALVSIRDIWTTCRVDPERIEAVFGLTRAESQLVARLVEGQPLRSAAADLHLSYHTVRTQLASALAKAGVNRQSDLLVRVARLADAPSSS